jgi:hypothetical protein
VLRGRISPAAASSSAETKTAVRARPTNGDLSIAAALPDTIADAAAAAGVGATGTIILATHGWYWLDPAAPAFAIIVACHSVALTRKVPGRLRPATAGSQTRT